ncbi:MAG: hypothetical protein MJZ75_01650 [Paludibacteraceae bacterium]|nr:hypothetical protein [Paludibacteraceae bacterium]
MKPSWIKNILYRTLKETSFHKQYQLRHHIIGTRQEAERLLNEGEIIRLRTSLTIKPRVGIIRDEDSIYPDYVNLKATWLRYERFCINNDIPYGFYDIWANDWMEKAKDFDIIIGRVMTSPAEKEVWMPKIYVLENILHKTCFPSYHEIWQYEDKIKASYLYRLAQLPAIPTKVTNSKLEALRWTEQDTYPFIVKTKIGASSSGVIKVNNRRQAVRLINRVFGMGRKVQYSYAWQKDYWYVQEFIEDATFDLRIMLYDNYAFGFYRYPDKGDFRASGAGHFEKKDLPLDALQLAIHARQALNSRQLGVDMLYSESRHQYFIIETSLFNQIDTPRQLEVNGEPSYYDISNPDCPTLHKGAIWIQELTIRQIIEQWHK